MDVFEISTDVRNVLKGFGGNARLLLRNKYIYAKIGRAVVEVKKSLKLPVADRPYTCVVNERGINLHSSTMELISVRIDAGSTTSNSASLGTDLPIIDETEMPY